MKKWEGKFLATTNWPQATKIEKCILDRQLAPVLKVNFEPYPRVANYIHNLRLLTLFNKFVID